MNGCETIEGDVLASCFPFLDDGQRQDFCHYLEFAAFSANEIIVKHGDIGDYMGFVVSGKLAVKKETEFPGRFILVALLQAGAMIGEMAVVNTQPRTATVVAVEESEMLILRHDKARLLLEENPVLWGKLLEKIIQVLGYRLQRSSERLAHLL